MAEMEVPPHFLCPISLQIMKDPVTISTGITYDRESIEEWLSSCTKRGVIILRCPVTKQALSENNGEDHMTPNHTLRRLIQGWCTLNAVHGVERIPTPKAQVDRGQLVVKLFKEAVKSPTSRLQCLQRLKAIVVETERNKIYLQDAKCLELLTSMLNMNNNNEDEEIKAVREEAIQLISMCNYCYSDTLVREVVMKKHKDIIDCSIGIAKTGSPHSRASAISLLSSIFTTAADQTQKSFTKDELFMEVTRAINDQIATKPALQILLQLAPSGRNRLKAVRNGAVFPLIELLLSNSSGRECELAMAALDRLCECAEGRAELLRHGAGLAAVGRKILRVSHLANEKAVRILHSVCKNNVCGEVGEEMVEVGVVGKLCLMLQVGVGLTLKTKQRLKDILQSYQSLYSNSNCLPPLPSSYHL